MLTSVKMEDSGCEQLDDYSFSILEGILPQVQELLGPSSLVGDLEYPREQEMQTTIKEEPLEEENEEGRDDFAPQQRSRCNTWPRRGLGEGVGVKEEGLPLVCEEEGRGEDAEEGEQREAIYLPTPKSNARRNPWGNFSYADLITQAIQSSPEGRLTLAQIYDWMIASVPYFGQRADSTSSAGWKNSIRHNLSLHQRFLKVQNEGAGKSSWWTLNPERKHCAKPRRRATSGDVKSLQSKREKARRKAESFRAGGRLIRTSSTNGLPPPSPSSDSLPDAFRPRSKSSISLDSTYFPQRPRTHSNASSISQTSPRGRLESLDSGVEGMECSDRMDDLLPDLRLLTSDDCSLGTAGPNDPPADLDSITLDDLSLGSSGPAIGDPALIIREYLHPRDRGLGRDHRLKILEPREETVGRSVIKHTNAELNSTNSSSSPLCYTSNPFLTSPAYRTRHDEARKDMIRRELEVLRQKRREVQGSQVTINRDNRKSLENAIDMQLQLLQEELDKQTRQEEPGLNCHMDISPDTVPRGQGTCVNIEAEGVGFNNCDPSDLHPNMCYPTTSSGPPPAAQFQQQSGEPDISELYLYSHSRRVPEVAYSCN